MDAVDRIVEQWARQRPDLDTAPMELIGRMARVRNHMARAMDQTFAEFGLNAASFDLLATLLRAGPPHALSPTDLAAMMMITSGTMTNRIDQLVKTGLVERRKSPTDGRGFLICLTPEGMALIDRAVTAHVATQARLVAALDPDQRAALNAALSGLLIGFEGEGAGDGAGDGAGKGGDAGEDTAT
ncbi:MarR family winged helix-turn-helix transcriptional regulator [Roseibium aestuarii]|uniref:MarR family winged helix-turn-helix transcriptional regulator n=1 Tax=Roseibium aestuarii TaxID=2600299 RepID=A0ABW4K0F1_9HYPH